jgi:hypothetical protein
MSWRRASAMPQVGVSYPIFPRPEIGHPSAGSSSLQVVDIKTGRRSLRGATLCRRTFESSSSAAPSVDASGDVADDAAEPTRLRVVGAASSVTASSVPV